MRNISWPTMAHENFLTTKKITRTEFFFRLAISSVSFETKLQLLPGRNSNETPVFVDSWLPYVYKEVWEAADAEEMPREEAIAHDGKLPVKDLFVSGSPFAGLE